MTTGDAFSTKRVDGDSASGRRRAMRFLVPLLMCSAAASLVGACSSFQGTQPDWAPTSMMSSCPGPISYRSPDCEPD